MSIEVFNESGHEGVNEEMLIDVASFALGEMDIHPDAEASIHIVDLTTIADLHVRWLDLEGPTDVMTFSVKTGYMIALLNQACTQFLHNDLNAAFPGRNSLMSKYGNIMHFSHCSVFPP